MLAKGGGDLVLPRIGSLDEYRAVYANNDVWLPVVREIRTRHGLAGPEVRQTLGTHVVFSLGQHILKVFCPLWPDDFRAERTALIHLNGVQTPEVVAEGEMEGWPYLIVTKLEGVPAASVWRGIAPRERVAVAAQLGRLMRSLHRAPLPQEAVRGDWDSFIRERLSRAQAHHAMPEPWLGWIREQLGGFREPPLPHVLLHADITEDHLLLIERAGTWEISGLIDLGDARVGHPFYEFIAPLAHYAYGDPELSAALLEAYGLERTRALQDVLTRYCLLHEFGTLSDFLQRRPVSTPEQFYTALWG